MHRETKEGGTNMELLNELPAISEWTFKVLFIIAWFIQIKTLKQQNEKLMDILDEERRRNQK